MQNKIIKPLNIAVLITLVFLVSFFKITNDDHWWHILTGLWQIDNHEIMTHDLFSFTFYGKEWNNWEWLSQIVSAFIWKAGEAKALIVYRMLLTYGIVFITLFHALKRNKNISFKSNSFQITAVLFLLIIQFRTGDRPYHLAYFLLAIFYLTDFYLKKSRKKWLLIILFLDLIIWRNVHSSWPFGVALYGATMLDSLYNDFRKKDLKKEWIFFSVFSLAFLSLSLFISPQPLAFIKDMSAINQVPLFDEWRPFFERFQPTIFYIAFLIFALLFLFAFIRNIKKTPFLLIFLFVTLYEVFVHVRFTSDFAMVALPLFPSVFSSCKFREKFDNKIYVAITIAVFAVIMVHQNNKFIGFNYGFSVDSHYNQVQMAGFMKDHEVKGNMLAGTSNSSSDYLLFRLWPYVKTYTDGRIPILYPFEHFKNFYSISENIESMLAKYNINLFVLTEDMFYGRNLFFANYLLNNFDYKLLYFGKDGAVFIKKGTPCENCKPYKYLSPWLMFDKEIDTRYKNGDSREIADEIVKYLADEQCSKEAEQLSQRLRFLADKSGNLSAEDDKKIITKIQECIVSRIN